MSGNKRYQRFFINSEVSDTFVTDKAIGEISGARNKRKLSRALPIELRLATTGLEPATASFDVTDSFITL